MGNCTGKQSKRKRKLSKGEVYKPSEEKPASESKEEINEGKSLDDRKEKMLEKMQHKETINQIENISDGKNGKKELQLSPNVDPSESKEEAGYQSRIEETPVEGPSAVEVQTTGHQSTIEETGAGQVTILEPETGDQSLVAVPAIGDQSEIVSEKDENSYSEPQGQLPSNNFVAKGDKQNTVNGAREKSVPKAETETISNKQKSTGLEKKPYLFARGRPMETEFIDTKSSPSDVTSNSDNVVETKIDPQDCSIQNVDKGRTTNEKPTPPSTEAQEEEPVKKDQEKSDQPEDSIWNEIPDEDSGEQKNQGQGEGEKTGHNESEFSNPGDEQDEKLSRQHKSSAKSKTSKKKKKEKIEEGRSSPQTVTITNYGNMKNVVVGNKGAVTMNKIKKEPKQTSGANIEPTFVITYKENEILMDVSKSVGFIRGSSETGTCWRVGHDKIITAYHVVRNNIYHSMFGGLHEPKLSEIDVIFEYNSKGDIQNSDNVFKVEQRVLYYDESLDFAILQLKENKNKPFPKPLKKFRGLELKSDMDKKIFLISHDRGEEKKINGGIGLWKPSEKRLEDLERFCQRNGWENGYTELDKPERLVLKCNFVGGASGSPGIVINNNNIPEVVLLYVRGFPDFYYDKQFPEEKRRTFPSDKILQQGVGIQYILKNMTKKTIYRSLRDEIFPDEAKDEEMVKNQQHQFAIGRQNLNILEDGRNIGKQSEKSVLKEINNSDQATPMQTCKDDANNQITHKIQDTSAYHRQSSQVIPSANVGTDHHSQIVLSGKRQEMNLSQYSRCDIGGHSEIVNRNNDVTDIPAIHQNKISATLSEQNPVTDTEAAHLEASNILSRKNQGHTNPVPSLTVDEWIGSGFQTHKDKYLDKDINLHRISKAINSDYLIQLGLSLGYQAVDVENIKTNNQKDNCFLLLVKWRNKTGHAATLDKLLQILKDLSETDMNSVNIGHLKDAISKFQ